MSKARWRRLRSRTIDNAWTEREASADPTTEPCWDGHAWRLGWRDGYGAALDGVGLPAWVVAFRLAALVIAFGAGLACSPLLP